MEGGYWNTAIFKLENFVRLICGKDETVLAAKWGTHWLPVSLEDIVCSVYKWVVQGLAIELIAALHIHNHIHVWSARHFWSLWSMTYVLSLLALQTYCSTKTWDPPRKNGLRVLFNPFLSNLSLSLHIGKVMHALILVQRVGAKAC